MNDENMPSIDGQPRVYDIAVLIAAGASLWLTGQIPRHDYSAALFIASTVLLVASHCLALMILGSPLATAIRPSLWGTAVMLFGFAGLASPLVVDRCSWMLIVI